MIDEDDALYSLSAYNNKSAGDIMGMLNVSEFVCLNHCPFFA